MKLSLVIPARNEEKRIPKTLLTYVAFLDDLRKKKVLDYEIIVVANACKDNTVSVVKKIARTAKRVKLIDRAVGPDGKGLGVMTGFKDALQRDADLIGFVDADMATEPQYFYDLIQNITGYDGIIASRYIPGASVFPKQSISRIVSSRAFNFLVRSLFFMSYKDTQCGAKLFTRAAAERITPDIHSNRWAFDVNMLHACKQHRLRVCEFPTVWKDQAYSVLNFKVAAPQMFLSLVRLRLMHSPFKGIVSLYNKFLHNRKLK